MAQVYNSGALSNLAYGNPLTVNHNLGYVPKVYAIYSVVSGVDGSFPPSDDGLPAVYIDSFDANQVVIKMKDNYAYSDDIKLICYDD